MEIRTHKDLKVWQESLALVEVIYELTKAFPSSEQYGLVSQLRRAAVSIPSNIAEGSARRGNKELIRFLYISLGSLSELETQVEIAIRLKYIIREKELENQIIYIRRMLLNLIKSLGR